MSLSEENMFATRRGVEAVWDRLWAHPSRELVQELKSAIVIEREATDHLIYDVLLRDERGVARTTGRSIAADVSVPQVISRLKRFGADSLERKGGVGGIDIEDDARALVNNLERYPHAFVLACIADRQTKADIAWRLPHLIHEAASGFEIDKLLRLTEREWASVLKSSGHRLATQMEQLLPASIRHIRDRYGGDASRIWAHGSSGAAVARRFVAFDGVGPKIANMAVNILIRDFRIRLTRPMPDIAVDTHVLRVFERLGLLGRLEHSQLRSTKDKQALRLQLRARELNPEWPGELDWPAWIVGKTWCHAGRAPECRECCMESVCPRDGVTSNSVVRPFP